MEDKGNKLTVERIEETKADCLENCFFFSSKAKDAWPEIPVLDTY